MSFRFRLRNFLSQTYWWKTWTPDRRKENKINVFQIRHKFLGLAENATQVQQFLITLFTLAPRSAWVIPSGEWKTLSTFCNKKQGSKIKRAPSQLKARTWVHLSTTLKALLESIKRFCALFLLRSANGGESVSQLARLSSTAVCHWGRGVSRQFSRTDVRKIHPALDTHTALHLTVYIYTHTPFCIYSFQVCRTQGLCLRWHYVLFTACGGGPRKGQLVQTNVSLPWQNIIKWEDVGQRRSFNKAERDASARFASIAAPKQQTLPPPSRNHFLHWQLQSPLR